MIKFNDEIAKILILCDSDKEAVLAFSRRLEKGNPTRDENPETHFCVYFAAYDSSAKKVFIGHHKKSGLWLFSGGHIDKGETPLEALKREIDEEWGISVPLDGIRPELLTITTIEKRPAGLCQRHYDIWYFFDLDKDKISFDKEKLDKEFYETRQLSPEDALKLVTDPNTIKALNLLKKRFSVVSSF